VHTSAEALAERIPSAVGTIEAVGERTCALHTGADDFETLAVYLACSASTSPSTSH
jgi:hypothetical protein